MPFAVRAFACAQGWNTWCTQNSCGVDWCTSAEVLDVAMTIKASGLQVPKLLYPDRTSAFKRRPALAVFAILSVSPT